MTNMVDYDLAHNPWSVTLGGITKQLEFWMGASRRPKNRQRAQLLYATPIYDQTVAQLAATKTVTFVPGPLHADNWYDDEFWVGDGWLGDDDYLDDWGTR